MLGHVGPMLGHLGSYAGAMFGRLAIYVETILRCQFFRPGPPPGVRNHVKNGGFVTSRRARNTVKKDVFEHRKQKTP